MKNTIRIVLILCLYSFFCVGRVSSQALPSAKPEEIGVSTAKLEELNKMIQDHIDRGELAGVVTLIARHGRVAQLKALGFMDIEAKKPARADALYRIASMTKVLTSLTALTLYEEGRFQLDDAVSKYIPEFKNVRVMESNPAGAKPVNPLKTSPLAREITIRDLFRHTAGFVYAYGNTPLDELYRQAGFLVWNKSVKEFVQRLTTMPLAYQPGTRWEYSYSFDVLGDLIEVLSGQPLNEVMKHRILTPLRMNDTDFFVPADRLERLTNYYEYKDGKLQLAEAAAQSEFIRPPAGLSGGGGWGTGFGGVVTTASDFSRCLQMILNRGELDGVRILKAETIALMLSNQIAGITNRGFEVSGYGLGVGVKPAANDPKSTESFSWAGGPYNTCFVVNLNRDIFCIFLTQTGPFGHLGIMDDFRSRAQACATE